VHSIEKGKEVVRGYGGLNVARTSSRTTAARSPSAAPLEEAPAATPAVAKKAAAAKTAKAKISKAKTTAPKAAGAKPKTKAARKSPPRKAKPRPPSEAELRRATEVMDRLDDEMPDAHIELDFTNDLELLVAVMLSAQCTDAMVNRCTPSLFAAYRTAADYAAAQPEDLYEHINRCGLYRNKAKNIVSAMQSIVSEHGGELPRTRAELEKLAGVGRKTAGVVAVHAFDGQAFPVDTHVGRLARRRGFTKNEDPDKVELDMQRLLPPERWGKGHQLLVWHGRRCCTARKPACFRCPVADLCPRVGVTDAV
jgi:endonuclease-3